MKDVFLAELARMELPGEGVRIWLEYRDRISKFDALERSACWDAVCARVAKVGSMVRADVWLRRAIEEENDRRKGL